MSPPVTSPVTVTATRDAREVFQVPHAVTLIDAAEVAESNATSTPDILWGTEGVFIQKTNTGGGSPFIRGLTGKQVLILIDGVRLNNAYYRFGPHQYLNTIDPSAIERIEVIRGPASVLYGSDALGGVVNIITRRRTDFGEARALEGVVQARGALADWQAAGHARVEGNAGPLGFTGGVSARRFGDLRGGGDIGVQIPTAYHEFDGDLTLNYRLGDHHELILAQQYVRQFDVPKTSEVTLGSKLQFDYEPQERSLTYLEYRGLSLVPGLFDQVKLNLSLNHQLEGERIIDESAPGLETRELTGVTTPGAILQLNSHLGRSQHFTWGAELYLDTFATSKVRLDLGTGDEETLTPGTPDGATYRSIGAWLQDEISLGRRLELVLGGRYSHFTARGTLTDQTTGEDIELELLAGKLTGSAQALVRVAPWLHLVGGVAQGFRAPNMEDFFGRVDFYSEVPNPDLKPESSLNLEGGLKLYTGHTWGDLYYFHSDYEGLIDRATIGTQDDGTPIKQRQNLQQATIQGLEAAIHHTLGERWTVGANATWTVGIDQETLKPLRRIPPLNGSVQLRYAFGARGWLELYSFWAAKQDQLSDGDIEDPRIGPEGTPGYVVLNARGAFRPTPNQEVLLTVENLTNAKYKSHGSGVYGTGINALATWRVRFR